jgi:hypothetical protein
MQRFILLTALLVLALTVFVGAASAGNTAGAGAGKITFSHDQAYDEEDGGD